MTRSLAPVLLVAGALVAAACGGGESALDAGDDTVALTGYTYGSMDFGGGALSYGGDADCFVAMLRPDGSLHR